jgi:hypothetical protein
MKSPPASLPSSRPTARLGQAPARRRITDKGLPENGAAIAHPEFIAVAAMPCSPAIQKPETQAGFSIHMPLRATYFSAKARRSPLMFLFPPAFRFVSATPTPHRSLQRDARSAAVRASALDSWAAGCATEPSPRLKSISNAKSACGDSGRPILSVTSAGIVAPVKATQNFHPLPSMFEGVCRDSREAAITAPLPLPLYPSCSSNEATRWP